MKAGWLSLATALGLSLAAGAACTILDAPAQCTTDDDCARFAARCDVAQAVCVARLAGDLDATDAGAPDNRDRPSPSPSASSPVSTPTPVPASTLPIVDAASPDAAEAGGPVSTIVCGATTCPVAPHSVCCIASDGTASCTTFADCTGAPVACDDTQDCAAAGKGGICCAFNDGVGPALLRAVCVPPDQCDANGPQDQLCSLTGPADQCDVATPGHSKCQTFTYSNATYPFCAVP